MPRRLVWLILTFACGAPAPDLERDRAQLLRLHDVARTAHLEKRADLMVASFDDSLRSVARGGVTLASPEENRTRMQAYFDRSTFQAWDDIEPPYLLLKALFILLTPLARLRGVQPLAETQVD